MKMVEYKGGKLPGPISATKPHERVSDKYKFFNTEHMVDILKKNGWQLSRYAYNKAKSRDGYQRHALEFLSEKSEFKVGDEKCRILFINSHDATTAKRFELGFIRLVCSNGLIVPTGMNQNFTLRHLEVDEGEISDVIVEISSGLLTAQKRIKEFKRISLSNSQVMMFAKAATEIRKRYYETELVLESCVEARRKEDHGTDLWTVYNRIQENCISGGARQYLQTPDNKKMERRLLPISSIKTDIEINKALWNVMENFASGKSKRVSQLISVN